MKIRYLGKPQIRNRSGGGGCASCKKHLSPTTVNDVTYTAHLPAGSFFFTKGEVKDLPEAVANELLQRGYRLNGVVQPIFEVVNDATH